VWHLMYLFQEGEAVRNDQCFGNGRQAASSTMVHLITSLIAALRQGL
jgi:hypothetical protein